MPVVIVNRWAEVTQELLRARYEEFMKSNNLRLERLFFGYWKSLVLQQSQLAARSGPTKDKTYKMTDVFGYVKPAKPKLSEEEKMFVAQARQQVVDAQKADLLTENNEVAPPADGEHIDTKGRRRRLLGWQKDMDEVEEVLVGGV